VRVGHCQDLIAKSRFRVCGGGFFLAPIIQTGKVPMSRKTPLLFSFVSILLCAGATVAGEPIALQKARTDQELIDILNANGYSQVEVAEDRVLMIKVAGLNYALYVYDDDDLQLYFGLTGFDVSVDAINQWNQSRRLSRAYLDSVNDPVVESDLLANAGYSDEQFVEFVNVFDVIAREFRQFVTDNDRDDD
jgi:hypothetical protein